MFALGLVMACIVFGSLGQVSLKIGVNSQERIEGMTDLLDARTIAGLLTNAYVIGGLLLYALSVFLWLGALSTLDVSFMYPLLSLGYVLTAIAAFVWIGESISLLRAAGIVLIVLGCILISRT